MARITRKFLNNTTIKLEEKARKKKLSAWTIGFLNVLNMPNLEKRLNNALFMLEEYKQEIKVQKAYIQCIKLVMKEKKKLIK